MHALLAPALVCGVILLACDRQPASGAQDGALPSSLRPAPNSESWANERRELVVRRAKEQAPARIVFVGDSITQGFEEKNGAAAWQQHMAPLDAVNLGCTGDRTEHVLWRLQQAPLTRLQPEQIVLLIGTNNLGHRTSNAQETLAGVLEVVRTLRAQCPNAILHLHEVFPRDERFSPMRGDVLQVNQALRAFVREENAKAGTAAKLRLHAFGDAFVQPDGSIDKATMPDFLHLSATSYESWAKALAAALRADTK
jgi:lysophospholipase L1-like esterase